MVILVYGDDSFRAQEKIFELRAAFEKKFDPTGLNLSVFPDAKTGKMDPAEVMRSATSFPFLAERRMVIARDLVASTKKDADWADSLDKIPTSTIFILWETKEPRELERKPLFKKLQTVAEAHFYPFPKLDGAGLSKWTSSRVIKHNGTIAPDALRALIERAGDDLWQLDGEIQKLVAYADDQQIIKPMVDQLVRATFDSQIFALMDAVSARRTSEVLKLLEEERASGAADGYIFSMLLRQIRILLATKNLLEENPRVSKDEAATVLGLHPFVVSKALQQTRGFNLNELQKTHELLYTLDVGMKSGKFNDKISVDLTVVSLLK
ncbi:MAG: polymerase III, delta subunit protein [Candidatus Uhrbacteria bacterium GW2011_GWF2_44_350]|uniref:DNA polymerase III subunit delta n=1 Tax=Candidatus Uhrbacteria bacterium GW2011_GWF2_44_350 TaxID=1619000 RepID=A0A0G1LLE8_9BACT|nr:MAG: polymerase III, delta subunit protein [Candidatus Uhrbacteria bacterium GW2011_GWF2_44_350]HBR80618.1 DNA polymerase III subunit delta [Candidatus Uhrbacteria bacterium]